MRLLIIPLTALALTVQLMGVSPSAGSSGPQRATWYWDPAPALGDAAARAAFVAFCREKHIDQVWAQVGVTESGDATELARSSDWQQLLREAHRAGLRIHALDGQPQYAAREGHARALAVVDAVVAFNAAAPPDARFDGIHFDNEPYLLLAWHDPAQRERLLGEFLELQAMVQARVHAAGHLEYGIDLPFWWQALDAETGEAIGVVTFRGVRKAASYHCLDLVDNVGIMDYRNSALGPDGLVAHAADLLAYADRAGRAKVYVGVETSSPHRAPYWFVTGISRDALRRALRGGPDAFARLDDHRPELLEMGEVVMAGVPSAPPDDVEAARRLSSLARTLGVATMVGEAAPSVAASLRVAARNPEWGDAYAAPITDPDTGDVFPGVRATRVTLPKLSFAGLTDVEMERELEIAERAFLQHRRYAGLAIHDVESYRARVAAGRGDRPTARPGRTRKSD